MKFTSNLLGFLSSAGKGNAKPDPGDTVLTVPGLVIPVASIPFPILNVYQSTVIAPGTGIIGSFAWAFSQAMNANSGTDMITLPQGVWELNIDARVREVGAVSDETSTFNVLLQIVNSGASVFSLLSRMNGKVGTSQRMERTFRVTVTKETAVIIRTEIGLGLGTTGYFSDLSVIGTRLL